MVVMNHSQKCYTFISIKLVKNVWGNKANSKIIQDTFILNFHSEISWLLQSYQVFFYLAHVELFIDLKNVPLNPFLNMAIN